MHTRQDTDTNTVAAATGSIDKKETKYEGSSHLALKVHHILHLRSSRHGALLARISPSSHRLAQTAGSSLKCSLKIARGTSVGNLVVENVFDPVLHLLALDVRIEHVIIDAVLKQKVLARVVIVQFLQLGHVSVDVFWGLEVA